MSAHARLSPSSAHRWIACPGSVRAESGMRDKRSEFSALGTAAHEMASQVLEAGGRDAYVRIGEKFDGGEEGEPWLFEADDDMCNAVQQYLDVVWECFDSLEGAEMAVETRVRVPNIGDNTWGTLDCRISQPFGPLHIFDYKHGQGVVVEVKNNEQMKLYALGTVAEAGRGYHDDVHLHIVQPRARHSDGAHRSWMTSEDELYAWLEQEVEHAAEAAMGQDGKLSAGDHCKFCKAMATCPVLRFAVQEAAAMDFADSPDNDPVRIAFLGKEMGDKDPDTLSQVLVRVPMIDAFIRAVEEEALHRLENGVEVPGFKLVRKKSNRAWINVEAALKRLRRMVSKKELMTIPALKSPAQVEKIKVVGKAKVADLCHKPLSGFTVAADSDPRQSEDPTQARADEAAADFAEDEVLT